MYQRGKQSKQQNFPASKKGQEEKKLLGAHPSPSCNLLCLATAATCKHLGCVTDLLLLERGDGFFDTK